MVKTKVRRAGPNSQGFKWCLVWQTLNMTAPAFWYYDTRAEARKRARGLREEHPRPNA